VGRCPNHEIEPRTDPGLQLVKPVEIIKRGVEFLVGARPLVLGQVMADRVEHELEKMGFLDGETQVRPSQACETRSSGLPGIGGVRRKDPRHSLI
jgi:hypothetical protein